MKSASTLVNKKFTFLEVSGTALALIGAVSGLGCGSDAEGEYVTPYKPGNVTVIGEQKGGQATELGACATTDECRAVNEECGDKAAADVILDDKGNVVDVICYEQAVEVADVTVDEVETAQAGNNTVLVIDADDDGNDVEGDITVDGNNAVVYGEGPDVSVIGGTLDISKNNAIVRGVRIKEDVTITKNDTKLIFCVIEGDLTITGNNTTLAECDVYGKVTITGLNTVLSQNRFSGIDSLSAHNLICSGNVRFDDADEDFAVSDDEVAGDVSCESSDEPPEPQKDAADVTESKDPKRSDVVPDAGAEAP